MSGREAKLEHIMCERDFSAGVKTLLSWICRLGNGLISSVLGNAKEKFDKSFFL